MELNCFGTGEITKYTLYSYTILMQQPMSRKYAILKQYLRGYPLSSAFDVVFWCSTGN